MRELGVFWEGGWSSVKFVRPGMKYFLALKRLIYLSFILSVILYFHKYAEVGRKGSKCRIINYSALYVNSRRLLASINRVAKK